MNETINPKDLVELLNEYNPIYINPDVKTIPWSTGEFQYEVDYIVSTGLDNKKNKLYSFIEFYQVDKDEKVDGHSLAKDHLNDLKKDLVSKGIDVNLENSVDHHYLLLTIRK